MNKQQMVDKLVEKTGMTKAGAEKFLNAFTETISDAMADGDKIQLIGFGTFETRGRAARQARNPQTGAREGKNPQTGEKIKIAACKVPVFKAGKALKDAVNK